MWNPGQLVRQCALGINTDCVLVIARPQIDITGSAYLYANTFFVIVVCVIIV